MPNSKPNFADLHGKEAVLLFTSALIANDTTLATLQALLPGLVIVSDAQNQASMIAAPRTGAINNRWSKNQRLLHLLTTAYDGSSTGT